MTTVRRRREEILAIITGERIETQQELIVALGTRGFIASQASASRDVAALRLAKVDGRYVPPLTAEPPPDPLVARIAGNLLSVASAGDHLLVLKTPPGESPGVALAVDRLELPGVVGTIAGDDTIFVAVDGPKSGTAVARRLRSMMS